MRAEAQSIPVETTKTEAAKRPMTPDPKGSDSTHAKLRRLEARLRDLEVSLSIIKRDVARIDRANYRKVTQPSDFLPRRENAPAEADSAFFM